MTQDEIIEMAKQAGFFVWTDEQKTIEGYGEDLERFAKLVAAKAWAAGYQQGVEDEQDWKTYSLQRVKQHE